jgi:predicted DNA-binding transcriptional regulator AlpA
MDSVKVPQVSITGRTDDRQLVGLLSASTVAELLDCKPSTVWRLAERGLLTRVRIGPRMVRYQAAEVARLMNPDPENAESPAVNPGSLANTAVAGGSDESYNPAA